MRGIELLAGAPQPATLTFKGPLEASAFKKRREIELAVSEADGMRRLLEAIGFVEVLRFQKRRESWRLDNCRVELDEVPRLGRFVEIDRVKKGGYFFDFFIEDGQFLVGTLRRLEGSRIYDLADYIV